jgi:site-specific recombinase XerD
MSALATMESAPSLPIQVSERLSVWATEARSALSENTQLAYAADSKVFSAWCASRGYATLPASTRQVCEFLRAESEAGLAVATIRRRASTISKMHQAAGLPNPCTDELVRMALKGIAKAKGTDQRQAAPLTERDAITIRAHMTESMRDVRDTALMLVGRDLLARSSELVSLQLSAIEWTEDGALVRLRRRKTATDTSTYFLGSDTAHALRAWLDRASIEVGAIFRSITKNGRVTDNVLSTRDVRRILKARAIGARLGHGAGVSGHSLRVGMAQDLTAANIDISAVMQAGAWKSERMVTRYTEKLSAKRGAVARYYGGR